MSTQAGKPLTQPAAQASAPAEVSSPWQPTASAAALRSRAALLAGIRAFFAERDVLEVETPLLGLASGTDPQLDPFALMADTQPSYLQTSPEFAMKRLLAADSGPIYQICKAFRRGDRGRRHNPEFTLLEWYRPDFDEFALMDEVAALLQQVLDCHSVHRLSYRALFVERLDIDPHRAPLSALQQLARAHIDIDCDDTERDLWLDLLFSHLIEPELQAPCFVYDYPASQAALARIHENEQGTPVARRFELLAGGMELANGYFELTDEQQQRERFVADQARRQALGKPMLSIDERLLAAMRSGLPACAGVALGVDRLLMLQQSVDAIDAVLAFPAERA